MGMIVDIPAIRNKSLKKNLMNLELDEKELKEI